MICVLEDTKPEEIQNSELAELVRRLRRLSNGGWDLLEKNHAAIVRLLKRALPLAKQEQEWYVYFEGLYSIIYQYARNDDIRELVKWAEVFYRDSALYADQALPRYPNTRFGYFITWTYETIFGAYSDSCEIDDAKMELFMRQYEENALKYGKTYSYYKAEMELGILYRDRELARHGAQLFEKYEHDMESCYVCGHRQYLGYDLLLGYRERAEERMLDFLHRRIPKKHLWCYKYCEMAEPQNLYTEILDYCIDLGNVTDFQYFYETYWLTLPRENRRTENFENTSRYLCAIAGDFEEADLQLAESDIRDAARCSTHGNMGSCLFWHCYFALLDKSGVHKITIDLPGFEADADGKTTTLDVSHYFEQKADEYGMKFAKARKKFDYAFVKESYRRCAGGVTLPKAPKEVNADMMTAAELHAKLQRGYDDMEVGKVQNAADVFKNR